MLRRVFLLGVAVLLVMTCKDATAPVLADQVLVTGPPVVHIGQHAQFIATTVDVHGNRLSRPVTWSSSDTTIATMSQQGLLTARALGSTTISAAADGKAGTSPLSVTLVPVLTVDVQPRGRDSLYVGDSLQLTATPHDSGGGPLANRSITWATSDSMKATVSANGLVLARGAGSFTVTATSEGMTGGTFLNAQLRAVALAMPDSFTIGLRHLVRLVPGLTSASGTQLSGRPLTWHTSDVHVLVVDQRGVVSPLTPGTAYVSVSSDTLRDSSLVRVVPEPAVSLTLAWTATTSIADTSIEALQAVASDAQGLSTDPGAITWASADTTVARIAPSPSDPSRAVLTGVHPGSSRIAAHNGSLVANYDLTLTFPLTRYLGQPDSMMLTVGDLRFLYEIGLDRFANPASPPYSTQTATSGDTSIISVILGAPWYVTGRRPGRTFIALRLTTPSGLFVDTVPVIVNSANARRLYWTDNLAGGNNYTSGPAQLVSADTNGALSTVPRDVQISSTDTSIVAPLQTSFPGITGNVSVPVRLGRPGVAVLTATGDSQFASLTVSVRATPPSAVHIAATSGGLHVGDTLRLHATMQDAPPTYPLSWKTTNPARATVTDSGTVTAVGTGDVGIVATSGSVSDTAALTVLSSAAPSLSAATPLPLVPGAQVTLTGSGFDPNLAADGVLIDSVAALVTSASDTALTLTLPATTAWPCTPIHQARVLITAGGRVGLDSLPLSVGTQHASLSVGDVLDTIGPACIEMPASNAGVSYAIMVNNTNQDVPASFAFGGAATIANPPPPQSEVAPAAGAGAPGAYPFSLDSLRRAAQFHRHILEQSRTLTRRLGAAAPLLRAARQAAPLRSVTAMIHNVAAIRIPKLEDPDFCSSYRTIQANLVYVGTHVLIFEDQAGPLAGTMTSDYQALGQEFDNVMYPKLLANFGNPLAMDSLLDGDGRIAMVFSPVVNTYGAAGFVVSCDFYPESVAPSSNTGEIFYAQAPTAFGTGFQRYTVDVWRWLIRSVVMHESKHLTAYAERLSRGAPIEDTWLEESSAVLAEELWSRPLYGATWKSDASYRLTVYCDVRPNFPECAGRPYSMFNAFAFLYDYTRQLEQRTPLGPTSNDDATFYGSGWSLLRWTIDQTASSESDFLRALVQEPSVTGLANLAARAQQPAADLLSDWSGALYFDSWGLTAPATHPAWTMPSWRMNNIFQGMSSDFPSSFPTSLPLQGRRWGFGGNFMFNVPALPPGGWALFVGLGSQSVNQLFDVHTNGSSAATGSLRIHIARVE